MSPHPEDCRARALRCAQLAEEASDPDLKQTLLHLAKTWARLADEVETTHALMHMAEPDPKNG